METVISNKAVTVLSPGSAYADFMLVFMPGQEKEKKVYGDRQGKRGKRENLVAGRRKGNKDLIAPMVFTGSLNAESFEGWLALYLLPSLTIPSILIMDNAPIHRKIAIRLLVEEAGHQILFLPKYSPNLNDIEHDLNRLIAPILLIETGDRAPQNQKSLTPQSGIGDNSGYLRSL